VSRFIEPMQSLTNSSMRTRPDMGSPNAELIHQPRIDRVVHLESATKNLQATIAVRNPGSESESNSLFRAPNRRVVPSNCRCHGYR
jgi:hypothetical protein